MARVRGLRDLREALAGDGLRPATILLSSTVLMLLWKYFGSPAFFAEHFTSWGDLCGDPRATAAIYSFASCFVLMGLLPAMVVKLWFKQRLGDYGVQLGDRRRTVRTLLLFGPLFVAIAYGSSRDPSIAAEYPINPTAGVSAGMFALHACTYALFYLGWEFHFRGFLQSGLAGKLGLVHAILIQVMASSLLHIGKPATETFGAIVGGVLWGIVAYRTRSLLSGLLQHFLLGIALDWFLCSM